MSLCYLSHTTHTHTNIRNLRRASDYFYRLKLKIVCRKGILIRYRLCMCLLKTCSSSYSLFKLVNCDGTMQLPGNDGISRFVDYSRQCPSQRSAENLTPQQSREFLYVKPQLQFLVSVLMCEDSWLSLWAAQWNIVWRRYIQSDLFTVEPHLHITSASFLIKFKVLLLKFSNSSLLLLPSLEKHEGAHCFLSIKSAWVLCFCCCFGAIFIYFFCLFMHCGCVSLCDGMTVA